MHPQTHTSPDGLLTLTSGPTRTINDAHPEQYDDWIIEIEPNGFHTHPDLLAPKGSPEWVLAEATQAFIDRIVEDRIILIVVARGSEITEVGWVNPDFDTLETAMLKEQTYRHLDPPDQTVTYRLWSGRVLATVR